MRIGLQIPSFTWPGGPRELRPRLAEIARSAEAAGFSSLSVMDHFFQLEFLGGAEHEMLEGYAALSFLAGVMNLNALNWLADNLKTVWLIAFVILFQPEIRRGLAQIGQRKIFRSLVATQESKVIGEVVLEDLPPRPKGTPIDVVYRYGLNQILEIDIVDLETRRVRRARMDLKGELNTSELAEAKKAIAAFSVCRSSSAIEVEVSMTTAAWKGRSSARSKRRISCGTSFS